MCNAVNIDAGRGDDSRNLGDGHPKRLLARQSAKWLFLRIVTALAFAVFAAWNSLEIYSLDYDEGVYLVSARMHLAGFGLYNDIFHAQPPVYIELLTLVFRIVGDNVLTGRVTAMICSSVCVFLVGAIAAFWFTPAGSVASSMVLAWLFLCHWTPTACQPEGMALMFYLISTYCVLRFIQSKRQAVLICGAAFLALAMATKLLVAPLALPLIMALVYRESRDRSKKIDLLSVLTFCLTCGVALAFILMPYQFALMWDQVVEYHRSARVAFIGSFARRISGVIELADAHRIALLLAGAGWILTWRFRRLFFIIMLWGGASLVFLCMHAPLFPRHTIILYPVISLAIAGAFEALCGRARGFALPSLPTYVLCIVTSGICANIAFQRYHRIMDIGPTEECMQRLLWAVKQDSLFVTDDQMLIFRLGGQTPAWVCDTSFVRIRSGRLSSESLINLSEGASYVILRTDRLATSRLFIEWLNRNSDALDCDSQLVIYRIRSRDGALPLNGLGK